MIVYGGVFDCQQDEEGLARSMLTTSPGDRGF